MPMIFGLLIIVALVKLILQLVRLILTISYLKRYLLVHYSEIGLKGSNLQYFVDRLHKRLKFVLEKALRKTFVVKHCLKRFLIELPGDFTNSALDELTYIDVLSKVFGIENFSFVFGGSIDLAVLAEQIHANLPDFSKCMNFCVRAKRSQILPYKSIDAERDLGARLIDFGLKLPVRLDDPDLRISVEFFNDTAYFSFKKYSGPGGLPANTGGKLISLVSGGFDSPVAAYRMMKRGARIIFVHFHAYPYTDMTEINNVKELVKKLSAYQFDTKLYLIPFGKVQKEISTNLDVPAKIRIILYRRMMIRIAEKIAHDEKAKGLVTGDNFGQVASQTSENIFAIDQASSIVVYRPLISFDKAEIIVQADVIGTHEISKMPCKDTCTMFAPKIPEIRANLRDILEVEKNLPISKFVDDSLSAAEIINFEA
ncbi:tRNA 4-thiouridine(8) synthase ThiI [Candidatus Peregrinibacteria bacterium]|nr:tRNA 4-thiouridine(8) synthase ThiI [Candidatus Peregrinibacteria bacterium]